MEKSNSLGKYKDLIIPDHKLDLSWVDLQPSGRFTDLLEVEIKVYEDFDGYPQIVALKLNKEQGKQLDHRIGETIKLREIRERSL